MWKVDQNLIIYEPTPAEVVIRLSRSVTSDFEDLSDLSFRKDYLNSEDPLGKRSLGHLATLNTSKSLIGD